MAEKQCTKCGQVKPISEFGINSGRTSRRTQCNACRREYLRARRAAGLIKSEVDPALKAQKLRREYEKRKARKHWMQPGERGRRLADKRRWRERKAAEQGRTLRPYEPSIGGSQSFEVQQDRLATVNAGQAWRWWLKICPDWWLRAYYRATGKPWNNPRLKPAERWRIRYWCDPTFRAKEIEKVQTLKVKRAARIAANNDGTLTGEVIVSLFRNATHCIYCLKAMRSVEKSLDHVQPLSEGGAHSIHNVVVCCKTCNTRKGRKNSLLINNIGSSPERIAGGSAAAQDAQFQRL